MIIQKYVTCSSFPVDRLHIVLIAYVARSRDIEEVGLCDLSRLTMWHVGEAPRVCGYPRLD